MSGLTLGTRLAAAAFLIGSAVAVGTAVGSDRHANHVSARRDPAMAGTVLTYATTTVPTTSTTATVAKTTIAPRASDAEAAGDRVVFDRSPSAVGQDALALISYPWQQRLHVTIAFAGPRAGMRAQSSTFTDGTEEVTVFVRPTATPRSVAIDVAHELGHLIDARLLTDGDREDWLRERGRPDAQWWTCDYCTDYAVGTGDFAETFAAWEVGPDDYRSQLAPLPGAEQMASLSRFFR
jgi:hypothetical protein